MILLVGNFLSKSTGVVNVGEGLAKKLAEAGYVVYTTSQVKNRLLRFCDILYTTWRLRDQYRVAQVDVFSGPSFIWAEAVCFLMRALEKPYILTLHGGNLPSFAKLHPGRVSRLLGSAAAVTVPSRYLLEQMKAYREGLILLPNPIELQNYPFHLRETLSPRLVWLRSFHSIYNPSLVPQVLARLAPKYPQVKIDMIGPDKGDGSLQEMLSLADQLGVRDRIIIHGAVPKEQVPEYLNRGDIFLNTTHFDNVPVSVIEAMACGLCIISTDVGGMPYLLQDEEDSLLIPPNDPNTMAASVDRLLEEPATAAKLSSAARKKVEAFDWAVVLPSWMQLFELAQLHQAGEMI